MTRNNAFKFCPRCGKKLNLTSDFVFKCEEKHPFYVSPVPTNIIILENDQGEILLAKRGIPPQKGLWDFSGGFISPNETLEESVLREAKEELDVEVRIIKYLGSYFGMYMHHNINYEVIAFAVVAKISKGIVKAKDDVSDFLFVKKGEVKTMKLAFPLLKKMFNDYLSQ
jgi:NADH pyrophosphatase NudC (nudix superfamily)